MTGEEKSHAKALIGFGTNRPGGAAAGQVRLATTVEQLAAAGLRVRRCSGLWCSLAWPDPRDPPFVNAVILVDVPAHVAEPEMIYPILRALEDVAGRERPYRWAPRPLDLDLLDLINAQKEKQKQTDRSPGRVQVPHPRAHQRAFVLAPLLQVLPDWHHPLLGQSGRTLLAQAPDRGAVWPLPVATDD